MNYLPGILCAVSSYVPSLYKISDCLKRPDCSKTYEAYLQDQDHVPESILKLNYHVSINI